MKSKNETRSAPECCSRHKVSKKIKMKKNKKSEWDKEKRGVRKGAKSKSKRVKSVRERDKEHIWPLYPWNIK